KGDLTARGNFATIKEGIIVDRRAGRIETEENRRIIRYLSERIKKIDDVDIILQSGKEHRFAVIFRGDGLSDRLTDADPHESGSPQTLAKAKDSTAEKAENIVNKFIALATDL
ncbi:MAG: phosphoglycerate mutase, partial [bacterium]